MTATATYDAVVSRVRVEADSLGATADYAVVDRTQDGGVTYVVVRGGQSIPVNGSEELDRAADDYEFLDGVAVTYRVRSYDASDVLQETFTDDITASITEPWLKFIAAPYLNRTIRILGLDAMSRVTRNGVFQVVGSPLPVVITDLHESRTMTLRLRTDTPSEGKYLDLALANGLPVFLHIPAGYLIDTMYATVGDFSQAPITMTPPFNLREFAILLTECAAPGADVFGFPGTWALVVSTYATWADLIADKATWHDVTELVGDPTDIIVGG